jgi:hypothetical protein
MALGLGIMVQSSAAQQQQSGKIIGARLTTPQPFNFVRVPPAQKAAAGEMMQKLYDIVRRDTMFYEPVAFDVQPSARIDVFPRSGYAPVQYDLPYFMFAYGPDTAKTQSGWRTSPRNFTAHGNGIELFFIEANKWQTDERGIMYFEPTRLPDIKGYPTYGRGLTVVTRSERPIFVSVPLERTMKVVIAENSKGLDAMKDPTQQPIVARMKACVAKHEKELAAMSPAERAGPTYVSMLPAPAAIGVAIRLPRRATRAPCASSWRTPTSMTPSVRSRTFKWCSSVSVASTRGSRSTSRSWSVSRIASIGRRWPR